MFSSKVCIQKSALIVIVCCFVLVCVCILSFVSLSSSKSLKSRASCTLENCDIDITKSSCKDWGLALYKPQPIHGDNELCTDGNLARVYKKDYQPLILVNMNEELKKCAKEFYVDKFNPYIADYMIADLCKLVAELERLYNINKKCRPYISAGFRSYETQDIIFTNDKCIYQHNNPRKPAPCGDAHPGWSTHQSIAIDIWCSTKSSDGTLSVLKKPDAPTVVNIIGENNLKEKYHFIHPISWDRPHFNYSQ